jgi:hypothetical protein
MSRRAKPRWRHSPRELAGEVINTPALHYSRLFAVALVYIPDQLARVRNSVSAGAQQFYIVGFQAGETVIQFDRFASAFCG